jgi:hypothetical protein
MDEYIKIMVDDKDALYEMVIDFIKYCKEHSYPIDELTWDMYYNTKI